MNENECKEMSIISDFIRCDIFQKTLVNALIMEDDSMIRIWVAISDCISVIKMFNENASDIEIESQGYLGSTKKVF